MTKLAQSHPSVLNGQLITIGAEVVAVYGDERSGFAFDPGDLQGPLPARYRYGTMDELYFALVNLNVGKEGCA